MLKLFHKKNKKGQNTAEYAILIALVVAAIIAMQTYAQRALQARVRGGVLYLNKGMGDQEAMMGQTLQYEPYYLESDYKVTRDTDETKRLGNDFVDQSSTVDRSRAEGGVQKSTYDASRPELDSGI